ncbi:MAG: hypothetical protein KJP09_10945 [Bacteroidia bacterium]|nr:hypothetical protein [Bacteroidia bacterium]NND10334.1 hypothetical protein [Flavobacteriaceae bacterium]MBT8309350.1 hypothetical protein [Bacteroidia bacterium]NNK27174.1 hypothetical protein [Flavobacteriaceae bacterium]NNL60832.1 hypothetical protein [Flavobacteriaceae bacterium]
MTYNTPWSKDELVAYILLFAANSNFIESNSEKNAIIAKVDMNTFQRIHDEFDGDNDYQSIQKIIQGLKDHNYTKEDLEELLSELKVMFLSDGEYDILEHNMMLWLRKIIS